MNLKKGGPLGPCWQHSSTGLSSSWPLGYPSLSFKDVHTLIPETYAYCILHGKRIFADIFKVIDFTMERLFSVIWVWIWSYELLKMRISPTRSRGYVAEEIEGLVLWGGKHNSCWFEDGKAKEEYRWSSLFKETRKLLADNQQENTNLSPTITGTKFYQPEQPLN